MSKIVNRLEKTMAAMKDAAESPALGPQLRKAAIDAMMGGRASKEYESYMSLFADNQEQLARLTAPIKADDPKWLEESRAYMIANSICGGDSTTQTGVKVEKDIDKGVSEAIDNMIVEPEDTPKPGGIKRPFKIPEV